MPLNSVDKHRRLSRYVRLEKPPVMAPSQRACDILQALDAFELLSTRQICELVFGSQRAVSYSRELLKRLWHAREIERHFIFRSPGSPATVYSPKRRNHATRSYYFLQHTLEANELLIAAIKLARAHSEVGITRILTEHQLKRVPIYVTTSEKTRQAVIPDGFVELRTPEQHNVGFELDRYSEWRPIVTKIQGWLMAERGGYQEWSGSDSLTVAFVNTLGGSRRRDQLASWAEKVLSATGWQRSADLFRFASFDPAAIDPHAMFFDRIWRRPFDPSPVALLEVDG